MNIEEIYLGVKLDEEELQKAIAFMFHLVPDDIAVTTELSGDEDLSNLKIICQYEEIEGDFKLKLQLFGVSSQDQDLFIDLVKKLSTFIKTDCLIPDGESLSPFDMIKISSEGNAEEVRLSTDQFENEKFCLEAS